MSELEKQRLEKYEFNNSRPPLLKDYDLEVNLYDYKKHEKLVGQEKMAVLVGGFKTKESGSGQIVYADQPLDQLEPYGITKSNLHSIKGMQWPYVFMTVTRTLFWNRLSQATILSRDVHVVREKYIGSDQTQLQGLARTIKAATGSSETIKGDGGGSLDIPLIGSIGASLSTEITDTKSMETGNTATAQVSSKWTVYEKEQKDVTLKADFAYCDWELVDHINVRFDLPSNVTSVFPLGNLADLSDADIKEVDVNSDYYCAVTRFEDSCAKDKLPEHHA